MVAGGGSIGDGFMAMAEGAGAGSDHAARRWPWKRSDRAGAGTRPSLLAGDGGVPRSQEERYADLGALPPRGDAYSGNMPRRGSSV
jgi:hypothetical protein